MRDSYIVDQTCGSCTEQNSANCANCKTGKKTLPKNFAKTLNEIREGSLFLAASEQQD